MPNTDIYGLMSVKGGQKQKIMNFSNAREKTYAQYQQLTDAQKKGVIIVDDYPIPEESDSVSITADGVKNWATLLNELNSLIDRDKVGFSTCLSADGHIFRLVSGGAALYFDAMNNLNSGAYNLCIKLSSNSTYTTWEVKSSGNNYIDNSTTGVPTSGAVITLIYDYYKNLDIHTEYLAKNCMLTGGGNVEDDLCKIYSFTVVLSSQTWTQSAGGIYYIPYASAFSVPDATTIMAVSIFGWDTIRATDVITPYISSNKVSLMSNVNSFASSDNSAVSIRVLYK